MKSKHKMLHEITTSPRGHHINTDLFDIPFCWLLTFRLSPKSWALCLGGLATNKIPINNPRRSWYACHYSLGQASPRLNCLIECLSAHEAWHSLGFNHAILHLSPRLNCSLGQASPRLNCLIACLSAHEAWHSLGFNQATLHLSMCLLWLIKKMSPFWMVVSFLEWHLQALTQNMDPGGSPQGECSMFAVAQCQSTILWPMHNLARIKESTRCPFFLIASYSTLISLIEKDVGICTISKASGMLQN